MSDVVNMRKQITHDGRGATIYDWLEEKEDEIDLETFECLYFLRILSQLHFKTGQLATVDVFGDEIWACTKADSFLSSESDLRTFLYQCAPGISIAKSKTFWEMKLEWKCEQTFPLAWYQIRQQAAGEAEAYPILGGFTYVAGCVWWNKWDNSRQAVRVLANKW